jgi:hypothetical protein
MRDCFFADEDVRGGFLGKYFSTTAVIFTLVVARLGGIERRTLGASELGTGAAVSCHIIIGALVGGRLGGLNVGCVIGVGVLPTIVG